MTSHVQAMVIGGGPAGVAAAMWLIKYDVRFEWLDRYGTIGGMLEEVHNPIHDFPSLHTKDGSELADAMRKWCSVEPRTGTVTSIRERAGGFFEVRLDDGDARVCRALLLATGTRKRKLEVPGEVEGLGRWVRNSTARDAAEFAGRHVTVVGGGDAAVEGALNLANAGAANVLILTRSGIQARDAFVEIMEQTRSIQVWPDEVEVKRIRGDDDGCIVVLDDGTELRTAALFVRIGVEPVIPEIDPAPVVDAHGFLVVSGRNATSVDGLFAAGDVTSTTLRSIATSVGDGARAARAVAEYCGFVR